MKTRFDLFILAVLLTTCACNNKERKLPDVDPVPFERYASNLQFSSKMLHSAVKYDILLPADYDKNPDKRYPTVYAFHGYGDDNTSWNGQYMKGASKIESLERDGLEPMIYVFPMGFKSYWCDAYDGSFPYMTMLAEEFIPFIDANYRTIADRGHRATIGYSMGGFGAMAFGMKHPELVSMSAPLSMSFRTDEQYMSESQNGWDNQWGKVFGGVGQTGAGRITDYYKAYCPLHQFTAENKDKYSSVHWFLTCGDDEQQLLIANDDLHVLMRENGYVHEYRVWNGAHSTSYWRAALEEVLPWFSALMAGNTDWQMTLKTVSVPDACTLNSDGVFESQGYIKGGRTGGVALFFFHEGLDTAILKDAIAILQDGLNNSKLVILPCDTRTRSAAEWVSYYSDLYPASDKQAVATGKAGESVFKCQERFSALYFENALLGGNVVADKDIYYYIGQCDMAEEYAGANALYKSCKAQGAKFEYRCRNHLNDARTDLLTGISYIKMNLHNI